MQSGAASGSTKHVLLAEVLTYIERTGMHIYGKVIHGDHYGRKLGFPTANIDRRQYAREHMNIAFGVWAGQAELVGRSGAAKTYPAAVVIGPLDRSGRPKLEAHIIGYRGNLYGRRLDITLHFFIRPFKKYASVDVLRRQIGRDITTVLRASTGKKPLKKFNNHRVIHV